MTTNTAAAASTNKAAKTFVAFFTREDTKGPKVELFKSLSEKARAPLYSGKIGTKQVSLFLRKGSKGSFLSLVGDKLEDGSGNSENLGTANVALLGNGIPVLVLDMIGSDGKKTPVFASISKMVDQDALIAIGMNVTKQAERKANPVVKVAPAAASVVPAEPVSAVAAKTTKTAKTAPAKA